MSICGEIEISKEELTQSLERLMRTSTLLTKIEETFNNTIKLHENAITMHEKAFKRLIELLET